MENPPDEHVRLENDFAIEVVKLLPFRARFESGDESHIPIIKIRKMQFNVMLNESDVILEYFAGALLMHKELMPLYDPSTTPANVARKIASIVNGGNR